MSKKLLLIFFLFIALFVILFYLEPLKDTNPGSPTFKKSEFRFSDYSHQNETYYLKGRKPISMSEIYSAIAYILVPGITQEEVDRILLSDPHVVKNQINHANGKIYQRYIYERWYMRFMPTPNNPAIHIIIEFDENNELVDFTYK